MYANDTAQVKFRKLGDSDSNITSPLHNSPNWKIEVLGALEQWNDLEIERRRLAKITGNTATPVLLFEF